MLRPGVRNLQAIAQYYNFTDVDVDRYRDRQATRAR